MQHLGERIRVLRTERNMTQQQVAEAVGVSTQAVSKWERGLGCPDVSLLGDLCDALGTNIDTLLRGEIMKNRLSAGNMKRIRFYRCPVCGNVMTGTAMAQAACCGRALSPLEPKEADDAHRAEVSEVDGELYITVAHPMEKEHSLAFAAMTTFERATLLPLFPEQDPAFRMPRVRQGTLYLVCARDGLFVQQI